MTAKSKLVIRILSSTWEGMHSEVLGEAGSQASGPVFPGPQGSSEKTCDMCLGRVSGSQMETAVEGARISNPDIFGLKALHHCGAKSLTRPSVPHRNLRCEDRRSCLPSPCPVLGIRMRTKKSGHRQCKVGQDKDSFAQEPWPHPGLNPWQGVG